MLHYLLDEHISPLWRDSLLQSILRSPWLAFITGEMGLSSKSMTG